MKNWLKKRMEEIKATAAAEQYAVPVHGAVGKKFETKPSDKSAREPRVIEVLARDLDYRTKATAYSAATSIPVWWVSNDATGRTTKMRDDTLGDDYQPVSGSPAPVVEPVKAPLKAKPASKPKATPPPKVEPPKKLINHIALLLDESGSMEPIQRAAVDAFNQTARSARERSFKNGQDATLSLVTFGGRIARKFFCDPVAGLRKLEYYEYRPDGQTPMLDAVGTTVEALLARSDSNDGNVSYVVAVITDGAENSSRQFSPATLTKLMAKVQQTDRWSFVFMVPPGRKAKVCETLGIPDGNVREWEASEKGMADLAQAIDAGLNSYATTRSAGGTSTKGFFVTDMNAVSTREVLAKLTNVQDRVLIGEVNRVADIREFVENDLRVSYSVGQAFYQLMKAEDVQYHKRVMLRSRANGAIYAGDEARRLLGLPDRLDVKVKPGDHGQWDIFIQSTSVNRKLVPGTKLLYMRDNV